MSTVCLRFYDCSTIVDVDNKLQSNSSPVVELATPVTDQQRSVTTGNSRATLANKIRQWTFGLIPKLLAPNHQLRHHIHNHW
jgi:hypothetical protein